MPTNLKGWHQGEREIHQKLDYSGVVSMAWTVISSGLGPDHREFHTTRLSFIPVTTLDSEGRPWGSIFAGAQGQPGFIKSPDDYTISMDVSLWAGDPFVKNHNLWTKPDGQRALIAGIGIEFSTRRRNKFAGSIKDLVTDPNNLKFKVTIDVNQALGNCPKYINTRDLIPHPNTSPAIVSVKLHLSKDESLPEDVISFIHDADTVFLGTSYEAPVENARNFPSHVGMNQRGGLPGFIRVRPSDRRTVVLPDFSGNRMMTSLGNIEVTPLASLTFVSFTTGDILYLTGEAKTLVGPEAQVIMRRQNILTTLWVTGYTLVRDALPTRQNPDIPVRRSPYSPPVKYLVEEQASSTTKYFDDAQASLIKIEILSPDLATFTFEVKEPIEILPGQAAVLDFTDFVGPQAYTHMDSLKPTSVNDDRIRTWTVSSAHIKGSTTTFELTMREKQGGAVTGPLFLIARKLQASMPELLADTRPLAMTVRLVGIVGDFVLPPSASNKLLFLAGGIGVTPFLSMVRALSHSDEEKDITFIMSTREPEVLVPLISEALESASKLKLTLDVFSSTKHIPDLVGHSNVTLRKHQGRLSAGFLTDPTFYGDLEDREIFLCGSGDFEKSVEDALGDESKRIRKEGFNY